MTRNLNPQPWLERCQTSIRNTWTGSGSVDLSLPARDPIFGSPLAKWIPKVLGSHQKVQQKPKTMWTRLQVGQLFVVVSEDPGTGTVCVWWNASAFCRDCCGAPRDRAGQRCFSMGFAPWPLENLHVMGSRTQLVD